MYQIIYNSTFSIFISGIISALLMLKLIEPKKSSVLMFIKTLKDFIKKPLFLSFTVAIVFTLLMNKYQLRLEQILEADFRTDYSRIFFAIEGNIVGIIQGLKNLPTTIFLTYMYVIIFPLLVWVSVIIYNHYEDTKMVKTVLYGFILNYILVLPFYVFFPINEAWYVNSEVTFLIPSIYPSFEETYRNFSGLNNCFPSLHTSLSLTMGFIAYHCNYKNLKRIIIPSSILITFSTLYLGIHWLLDVVGGIIYAYAITKVSLSMAEKSPLERLKELKYKKITQFSE